jgi:nitroreductase
VPGKKNKYFGRRKMEVLEAIHNRRSIRSYKPDPPEERDIQTVLDAARWAPSWSNTQCWRFIVVRDAAIKSEIAECLMKREREGVLVDNPAYKGVLQAPVLIVFCAELGKSGKYFSDTLNTDKGDWFMYDVALASQNLALAAHSLGLGTVIIGAFDAKKVAEILEIPEGYCAVSITPLGYPEHEGKAPGRRELSEIAFHDKYGQ